MNGPVNGYRQLASLVVTHKISHQYELDLGGFNGHTV